MDILEISYQDTNFFSKLILDYLSEDVKLSPFVSCFPSLDNLGEQILKKQAHTVDRKSLVQVLKEQNSDYVISNKTQDNIDSLLSKNTFTVTTGHQLCLFTGPLYFIYKIISTINLVEQLQKKYPNNSFVPIFWMASEDHDLEEINHIHLFGKKIVWNTDQKGMVGKMNLSGLASVLDELELSLGNSKNAKELVSVFRDAYLKYNSLADATRYLVNQLFGKFGLVVLDGNDVSLKKSFIPVIEKDILQKGFQQSIKDCTSHLQKSYKKQVHIRERNFFKVSENSRERINNTVHKQEIDNHPDSFSPNVFLRCLYQEMILPNIAYIGGGAEIAYWMQLKFVFEQENIPFPVLLLRNSVMLLDMKQNKRRKELGLSLRDLFLEEDELERRFILSKKELDISINSEVKQIELAYKNLFKKITDASLRASAISQFHKQKKVFKNLEKKLLKLEKMKHKASLKQIRKLKRNLFPNNDLQERILNFSSFYLTHGNSFIEIMKDNLNPLKPNFVVLASKTD